MMQDHVHDIMHAHGCTAWIASLVAILPEIQSRFFAWNSHEVHVHGMSVHVACQQQLLDIWCIASALETARLRAVSCMPCGTSSSVDLGIYKDLIDLDDHQPYIESIINLD